MRTLMILAGACLALTTFACKGSKYHGPYDRAWYDVYGNHCHTGYPQPGCNFYEDGSKIHDVGDPYYDQHHLDYDAYYYTDSYGFSQIYIGWGWLSPNGILYDNYGIALNETGQEIGNDIIEAAAEQNEVMVKVAGKSFSERFALQEATGVDIARTLNEWATLTKDRKVRVRTDKDVADFSKRLFGVDVNAAKVALGAATQGDLNQVKQLNRQIAERWGTNPETSEQILKNWFDTADMN